MAAETETGSSPAVYGTTHELTDNMREFLDGQKYAVLGRRLDRLLRAERDGICCQIRCPKWLSVSIPKAQVFQRPPLTWALVVERVTRIELA